jgi:hypothetical protein
MSNTAGEKTGEMPMNPGGLSGSAATSGGRDPGGGQGTVGGGAAMTGGAGDRPAAPGGSNSGGRSGMGGMTPAGAGSAGRGGSAGSGGGGNAGRGGSTAAGGMAAGGGSAGRGGSAAAGGAGTGGSSSVVCNGCARLYAPLTSAADKVHFTITLPVTADFRAASISMHVARVAGIGGKITAYVQEGPPRYFALYSPSIDLGALKTSVQVLTWTPKPVAEMAELSTINRIGIELNGVGGTVFANPTVIDIDRIEVSGVTTLPRTAWDFENALSVYQEPTTFGPVDRMWLNSSTYDTTITGAAISWIGSDTN